MGIFAAVDVYYPEPGGAVAALVTATEPTFAELSGERTATLAEVAPYRPGAFYERELPALRAVLAGTTPDLLIIDGYVHLDPAGRPGLGAHAHTEFGVPVIGVAKTPFRSATHALPVLRGSGTRPLFVSSIGVDPPVAATLVRDMAGPHRLPDALRRVDALSRSRT